MSGEKTKDEVSEAWASIGNQFSGLIEGFKRDHHNPTMNMVDLVFACALENAISVAHKNGLTTPVDIAAFVTGYFSSMGIIPGKK